jgi:hypothetical protein
MAALCVVFKACSSASKPLNREDGDQSLLQSTQLDYDVVLVRVRLADITPPLYWLKSTTLPFFFLLVTHHPRRPPRPPRRQSS